MASIFETIMTVIVCIISVFVPMSEDGVSVDFVEQVATETTVIVCEYKNNTNRIISEPHICNLSKKVDGEWQTVADIPVPEASTRIMPGRRGTLCSFNIELHTGKTHLEEGEYKFIMIYDVYLYDESISVRAEVPFTVE